MNFLEIPLFLSHKTIVRAAHAQHIINSEFQTSITEGTGLASTDPLIVATVIVNFVLGILALLCVAYILYAGLTWMTSAGNEEKIKKAQKSLLYTTIGLLILLSAWGITQYVITLASSATQ